MEYWEDRIYDGGVVNAILDHWVVQSHQRGDRLYCMEEEKV